MSRNKNKREDKRERLPIKESLKNVWFVLKYLYRANKKLFFVRIPLLLFNTLSSLVSMIFLQTILNELTGGGTIKTVLMFVAGFAVAKFIISMISRSINLYDKLQLEKTSYTIKRMLGESISRMPLSDVEDPRMRDFIGLAASSDSFSTVIEHTMGFLGALINVITYASIVLSVHPVILLLIAAVVVIQILINKLKLNKDYAWRVRQAPIIRRLNYFIARLSDPKCGKEMRVNQLQNYFIDKSNNFFDDEVDPIVRQHAVEGSGLYLVIEIAKIIQKLFIYLILASRVVFHGMKIGDFSLYLSSADKLTSCLSDIVDRFSNLLACGVFAKEFRYCIEASEKSCISSGSESVSSGSDFSIEFRNVSYKYPNTDNYVLKNISFKINSGESLSLVGVNGSGKSTLVKLICRFYEPTEGDILIGNINSKKIPLNEYSKLLGVIFQDFKLFSFSICENISMNTQYDRSKLINSIENSGLAAKIKSLEHGTDTSIYKEFDENGIEFSGGEGQKLAIARVIYKDAPIIILDEPTSALDPIAEYEIYQHFNNISKDKTAIYISHRLSSTRFTDKIAVLAEGELKEFGSHKELMSLSNGIYKNMFQMQAQYYI